MMEDASVFVRLERENIWNEHEHARSPDLLTVLKKSIPYRVLAPDDETFFVGTAVAVLSIFQIQLFGLLYVKSLAVEDLLLTDLSLGQVGMDPAAQACLDDLNTIPLPFCHAYSL